MAITAAYAAATEVNGGSGVNVDRPVALSVTVVPERTCERSVLWSTVVVIVCLPLAERARLPSDQFAPVATPANRRYVNP
jgi:hypothetical protein